MDTSVACVKSAKENIPLAKEKIAHDRFDIITMPNKVADKT
jgi:hypothetical protein